MLLNYFYLKALAVTPDVPVLDEAEMHVVLEKFKSYGLRVEKQEV